MKLLIILIASISCYVSVAVKHGVTATRWFKDNTFYVEFHNNTFGYGLNVQRQDHDLVCEVIYNLDITDLNTYTI